MRIYSGLILLLLGTILCLGCGRDNCNHVSNVSINTNINRGQHLGVYSAGGWAYAEGGTCGLIVYNIDGSRLTAYDRCSNVMGSQGNQVKVDGMLIVDEVSGAKWLLLDGSPAEKAECHLRTYHVTRSGDNFYVRN